MSLEPLSQSKGNPYKASIDRIDSSLGYLQNNVRLTVWAINRAIGDYGADLYLKLAEAAVARQWLKI